MIIATGALFALPFLGGAYASERDGIQYYLAHLSEYKGKEIQVLAHGADVVGETKIKEGYIDTNPMTENGMIHCLVKKDRIDGFMNRYRGYDPKILRGTLLVTENENPYLLIDGF